MIIWIDASNIRSGGGIIHLGKILSINDPKIFKSLFLNTKIFDVGNI